MIQLRINYGSLIAFLIPTILIAQTIDTVRPAIRISNTNKRATIKVWEYSIDNTVPTSARQTGMGNVGLSLANTNELISLNPSGLGRPNPEWQSLSAAFFYQPLFSSLGYNHDPYQMKAAFCLQPANNKYGGFGCSIKLLGFGIQEFYNNQGAVIALSRDVLTEIGASYGKELSFMGFNNHSIGVTLKFVSGPLYYDFYSMNKSTFLLDCGYSSILFNHLTLGLAVHNIGKQLYGLEYKVSEKTDSAGILKLITFSPQTNSSYSLTPTDFAVSIGLKQEIERFNFKLFEYFIETNLYQQAYPTYNANINGVLFRNGYEVGFFKTIYQRFGIEYAVIQKNLQYHLGFGLRFLNHFQGDYFYISTNQQKSYQDKNWGYSFSMTNMFKWSKNDWAWMLAR